MGFLLVFHPLVIFIVIDLSCSPFWSGCACHSSSCRWIGWWGPFGVLEPFLIFLFHWLFCGWCSPWWLMIPQGVCWSWLYSGAWCAAHSFSSFVIAEEWILCRIWSGIWCSWLIPAVFHCKLLFDWLWDYSWVWSGYGLYHFLWQGFASDWFWIWFFGRFWVRFFVLFLLPVFVWWYENVVWLCERWSGWFVC